MDFRLYPNPGRFHLGILNYMHVSKEGRAPSSQVDMNLGRHHAPSTRDSQFHWHANTGVTLSGAHTLFFLVFISGSAGSLLLHAGFPQLWSARAAL